MAEVIRIEVDEEGVRQLGIALGVGFAIGAGFVAFNYFKQQRAHAELHEAHARAKAIHGLNLLRQFEVEKFTKCMTCGSNKHGTDNH